MNWFGWSKSERMSGTELIKRALEDFLESLKDTYPAAIQAAVQASGPSYDQLHVSGKAFAAGIRQAVEREVAMRIQLLTKKDEEQRACIRQLEAEVSQYQKDLKESESEIKKYGKIIESKNQTNYELEERITAQNSILSQQHQRLMGLLGNVDEDESKA